ncbi:MAG: membrane dipeptidase [Planctomycetes bacterium]|nr:membrane dipeptidase [Planctomycetota bacterium]
MLTFDAHLDLSMNALEWNRDLTQPLADIRAREASLKDKPDRGAGVVSLGEMRRGQIGICVATQIARYVPPGGKLLGWNSPEIAWSQTQGQLAWYRAMEEAGQMFPIVDRRGLDRMVELWSNDPPADAPIGYILSLEGADSILTPRHLERAHAQGLRAVGPAHYGPGRYAQGTHATGGLGPRGKELLDVMRELNIILDATHLCDDSFWEAIKVWDGPVWASHQNCRALVPGNRQFSDEQLKELIGRGCVFGAVFDAWMMTPDWTIGKTRPEQSGLKIERIVDHMDHICQLAGNARHIGIGSDLDGGFGREQCPQDMDSIADLARIPDMLARRGYSPEDVAAVMHGNFLRFLREAWRS